MHHPRSDRTGKNAGLWRRRRGKLVKAAHVDGAHFDRCNVRLLGQINCNRYMYYYVQMTAIECVYKDIRQLLQSHQPRQFLRLLGFLGCKRSKSLEMNQQQKQPRRRPRGRESDFCTAQMRKKKARACVRPVFLSSRAPIPWSLSQHSTWFGSAIRVPVSPGSGTPLCIVHSSLFVTFSRLHLQLHLPRAAPERNAFFGGLVLGCIKTKFYKKICV